MNIETILYFCNSYLLMLDYYESLDEVISDFIGKETEEKVQQLEDECRAVLHLKKKERIMKMEEIIADIKYMKLEVSQIENVLKEIIAKI